MDTDPDARPAVAHGSPLYYSLRFLPSERRQAATALYGVVGALQQATAGVRDEAVARAKLAWWREELQRLYQGGARHPATAALQPWLGHYTLPAEYFQEILAGLDMDLEQTHYADFRQLRLYCQHLGANPALLASEVFGYRDPHTPRFAQALGVAHCLSRALRQVREDAQGGSLHLPGDELQRFGVRSADLHLPQSNERVHGLLAFQLERVREQYRHALTLLPQRDAETQHPFLIQAALDLALWEETERDGLRLLEHQVELPVLRRLWIAWRTYRRTRRGGRVAGPGR